MIQALFAFQGRQISLPIQMVVSEQSLEVFSSELILTNNMYHRREFCLNLVLNAALLLNVYQLTISQ